ncbi:AMP-binding protein [Nocardiopsis sp. HNM0947]|uniref:AMP-binding protein n=1 Tax=Nocardiopsis coralli TaxID=2772213 RepID=A0ABR9PDI3_9ACTN|nr:AMP-binding protein [Nocardiopsis coralli]MBE3001904.1 AMP-binding protein [Nocardiopsis coralli]
MSNDASVGAAEFRAARDLLLELRLEQATAHHRFTWPATDDFNWAIDHFDEVAERRPDRTALWIVEEDGSHSRYTYRHMSERSNQVANWLNSQGVHAGDRVLLMLGNQVELWECMLAALKLGAVLCPTPVALTETDLVDRLERGEIAHVVCGPPETEKFAGLQGHWTRICVGYMEGWLSYADSEHAGLEFRPPERSEPDDPYLVYFTSGTTALPKLVTHSRISYPVGHLSTMYWLGVQPGDVHLNISVPGWSKHAFSSVFAPWNAEATVLVLNHLRFDPDRLLEELTDRGVDTLCAPPTVWRMLAERDMASRDVQLREVVSAGEPLTADIVEKVRTAWDLTVRDGFGQTEATMLVGNAPGQVVVPGSMGHPLPGYDMVLLDPESGEPVADGDPGELCVDLGQGPVGVMQGYADDTALSREVTRGGVLHTGDVAVRGDEGFLTYVGRTDDVFKASDYRISPYELESVLSEHPAVAEVAVVPSPDPLRLSVVKAFVVPAEGASPDEETARSVLEYSWERLSPYKRVRRVEFTELPKTVSGKIRRVELRRAEADRGSVIDGSRNRHEFWEEDLVD